MNRALVYFLFGIVALPIVYGVDVRPVDFGADIMPILEQSCLKCHGPEKQKSDFRVDEMAILFGGGGSGIPGIVPGNAEESFIFELITTGDEDDRMPPEGKADPLTDTQIALLERWINEGASLEGEPELTVDYVTQIQPIFEKNCYQCHGPELHESDLRTDLRPSLLKGGGTGAPAIVPGNIGDGELLKRLHSTDKEYRMPRGGEPLPAEDLKLLATWIVEGADWPGQMDAVLEKETTELWSMQPVIKPELPLIAAESNPIDAFLDRELSAHGLPVNGPADPGTLIRRASIVLTGLPATPVRIQSFIADWNEDSSLAYNALLDELFASPHYGERWAQHWLDVIRWAETTGYESNEFRKNAWPYRDYVVEAFNRDKPYDQFVREQLAGDSFGEDVAMGLLVAGPHSPAATVGQQPTDIRQARFDRLDETIQSVSASMMAMTFACARCHNHKFDPISIKDYYSMAAVFNDVEFDHRKPNLSKKDPRMIALQAILAEIAEVRAQFDGSADWTEDWKDHIKVHFPEVATKSIRFQFKKAPLSLDEIQLYNGATSSENLTQQDGVVVRTSKVKESLSRPPEFLIDNRLEKHFGWILKKAEVESAPWIQIDFPEATKLSRADLSVDRLAHYGWKYMIKKDGSPIVAKLPKTLLRVEVLGVDGVWKTVATQEDKDRSDEYRARVTRLNQLAARHDVEGPVPLFIGRLIEPTKMHVMHRGSPVNPRAEVTPMALEVLGGDFNQTSETPGPDRRLAFAEWLTDPENPLTARVMVNRLWHHVFGTGIVSTPADFGFAGGTPSHPELLDWLASDFIAEGWSIKTMLRKILTAEAFMRSSAPSKEWLAADSDSRLLWRFPPRWLEAEVLRDSILQAAGTLDLRTGGEGYHIYRPKTRYSQWKVTNNHGPDTWRRMLYQQRMRRVDDQMFTAFDFPDCAQVQSKRTRSTTPLQAFNLLNGNLVIEQAGFLAERVADGAATSLDEQLRMMFMLTLGREPDVDELSLTSLLAETDGLRAVGRALFNLNEFFYLN